MKQRSFAVFTLGLQHVLAMYTGAILVPLLVGRALNVTSEQLSYLLAIDLLTCGVATLLQTLRGAYIGIGLPVMLGSSFVAVTPMIAIGANYGIHAIYGSIIAAGVFIFLFARFFGKLTVLFPPVVTGTVVTLIGLSLVPTGVKNMAGGSANPEYGSLENLLLSVGVLMLILVLNRFLKGFARTLSVLIGIAAGTAAAAIMGKVSFSAVAEAPFFQIPKPFYFGAPSFEIGPILTMLIVGIVIIVESTGVFYAIGKICGRPLTEKDLVKGYRAEGIAILIGGLFNAFPYNTFAQNAGLLQLTKVKTRNVIVTAGCILVCLGLIPKIAALASAVPAAVLGGATVVMFGMVIASGVKMLSTADLTNQYHLLTIACSIALGIGASTVPGIFAEFPAPIRILVSDGTITGSLTAIFLNLFFSLREKKETTAQKTELPILDHTLALEKEV
ncbi:uric acid permease PucJ [Bacillus inaquosorum]|uniref:Uric acid permease PucJ n=1 Tax=Bacillus inaquosorum TaxID=483913 RepID=A0A9Q4ER75_9BACI|nr:uric acid permease PucJ [Bacillus inaquosorum]MCY7786882.1 uric acid permease PucJ [Bacillus inaquosorum]MCY7819174.1 uric acid permease PucJ [Bacillus inaquosorum]MCY7939006.1 uric acid permease PucJ [Bacillus inaquosorum]MCY7974184.1 uric acid permease PucJ [Bacillus inaquosorum]MCY8081911.1 uric acid permease PucJ [Bacillus inaquosorum]